MSENNNQHDSVRKLLREQHDDRRDRTTNDRVITNIARETDSKDSYLEPMSPKHIRDMLDALGL